MIRPPGFAAAAFGTASTGDLRRDVAARTEAANRLGIPDEWAYLNQVHGNRVVAARHPGNLGDGDALVVEQIGLPIMVATADCVPVIIEAVDAAAVVHAGWRGAAEGVLPATLEVLRKAGHEPTRAAIGPAIGPCCYEVGDEVADRFADHRSTTTWGTSSVDIPGYLERELQGIEVWRSEVCTYTSKKMNSWRRDKDERRQVAVTWLPAN